MGPVMLPPGKAGVDGAFCPGGPGWPLGPPGPGGPGGPCGPGFPGAPSFPEKKKPSRGLGIGLTEW